ncbi:hypothetical protein K458DRAFT_395717 [Lentithecium fluviatile CBS 122367]|uniref:Uncharacterized protein n=1 Tax=Lentithecium fluviatile CBS 122367 TaxID=1168545 RepID=A0A6G1IHE0_9PLEO|nr:hypothetical protein K458DRAFT_395717 [Lentithecium fluviatile CBS 122367]
MLFLDLPAEIRNQIYSYLTLVNAHHSQYHGLFLGCKRVDSEATNESLRSFTKFLNEVEQIPMEDLKSTAHIAKPLSLPDLSSVTASIPYLAFRLDMRESSHTPHAPIILKLGMLHLTCLHIDIFQRLSRRYSQSRSNGMNAYLCMNLP